MDSLPISREAKLKSRVLRTLDRGFDASFLVYLFLTIFLPSGSIYGINVKSPLYALLIPLAVYSFFRRKQATAGSIILLAAVLALLTCWLLIGLSHGFAVAGAVRQYTDFGLTLFLCWMAFLFSNHQESKKLSFLKVLLGSVIAAALLKMGLLAYAFVRGISVVEMMTTFSAVFGVSLMTMDLGDFFGRVQFVSDSLIPVCVFVVLRYRMPLRIGAIQASLILLLLLASTLLSFSRYFWGFTVIGLMLGLLLGKRDRLQAFLLCSIVAVVLVSLPVLIPLYQLRFSQQIAGGSDSERVNQSDALKQFFLDAPLFGHGFGSYTPQVLREDDTEVGRYGYEMQLLALLGQVGVLGMIFLSALAANYFKAIWWKSALPIADRVGLLVLLAFWLAAGLYNPLLFNPVAGAVYALLATLASMRWDQPVTLSRHAKGIAAPHLSRSQSAYGALL